MRREGRPVRLCGAEETEPKSRLLSAVRRKRSRKTVCCLPRGEKKPESRPSYAAQKGLWRVGLPRADSTAVFTLPPKKCGGAFAASAHCFRRAVTCRTDRFLYRAVTRAGARDHRKTETICRIKPLYHTAPGKSRRDRPHVFAEAAANDRPHAKKRPKSIFSGRFLFLLCILYLLLLFNFNLLFFVKNRSFLHAFYDFNPL